MATKELVSPDEAGLAPTPFLKEKGDYTEGFFNLPNAAMAGEVVLFGGVRHSV